MKVGYCGFGKPHLTWWCGRWKATLFLGFGALSATGSTVQEAYKNLQKEWDRLGGRI